LLESGSECHHQALGRAFAAGGARGRVTRLVVFTLSTRLLRALRGCVRRGAVGLDDGRGIEHTVRGTSLAPLDNRGTLPAQARPLPAWRRALASSPQTPQQAFHRRFLSHLEVAGKSQIIPFTLSTESRRPEPDTPGDFFRPGRPPVSFRPRRVY